MVADGQSKCGSRRVRIQGFFETPATHQVSGGSKEGLMRTSVFKSVELGELVAAIFDEAGRYSTDPLEVSLLATSAVMDILERKERTSLFRNRSLQTRKRAVSRDVGHAAKSIFS